MDWWQEIIVDSQRRGDGGGRSDSESPTRSDKQHNQKERQCDRSLVDRQKGKKPYQDTNGSKRRCIAIAQLSRCAEPVSLWRARSHVSGGVHLWIVPNRQFQGAASE